VNDVRHFNWKMNKKENKNMNKSAFKNSRYITQDEVREKGGLRVTVDETVKENVALQGEKPRIRPVIHFTDHDKSFVCNATNAEIIFDQTGTVDSDDWVGVVLELGVDPSVAFGGKVTGGIRVTSAKRPAEPSKPKAKAKRKELSLL
jgi:hypothetical protein